MGRRRYGSTSQYNANWHVTRRPYEPYVPLSGSNRRKRKGRSRGKRISVDFNCEQRIFGLLGQQFLLLSRLQKNHP